MGEPPPPFAEVDEVEESRTWIYDGTNWVQLLGTANGRLEIKLYDTSETEIDPATEPTLSSLAAAVEANATDEIRASIYAEDDAGNLAEIQGEELGTALGGTETALVTYVAQALAAVGNDELRARLFAEDDAGNLAEIQGEELGTALGGTETALVTYVAQALSSIGNDEIRSRLFDSTGTAIDPATNALEDALEANAADEFRVSVYAADDAGNLVEVQAEELGTALGGTESAIITYLSQALSSIGNDELRVDTSPSEPLDVSAARILANLELEDAGATGSFANIHRRADALQTSLENDQVGLALDATLSNTLNRNVAQVGGAAQSAVDIANVLDQLEDALASVGTDELRVDTAPSEPLDVSSATVTTDPDTDAFDFLDGTGNLASGGTLTVTVEAQGAEEVHVIARSSDTYSVDIEWQDGNGNTLFDQTDVFGGSLTAGNTTDGVFEMKTPQAVVEINEDGGSGNAQDATLSAHAK